MKKLTFIALFLSAFALSCKSKTFKYSSTTKPCVIVSVQEFTPGQIHTLQTDYVWRGVTDCGFAFSSHRPLKVGDTVYLEKRKYVE